MKIVRIYGVQILFILVILIAGNVLYSQNIKNASQSGYQCEDFRTDWQLSVQGQTFNFDELPQYYSGGDIDEIVLSRTVEGKDTIGFFVAQQQVFVYLDEEEILRFAKLEFVKSKTPGGGWLFVELSDKDAGKTLSIRILPCYDSNKIKLPVLYHGTRAGIITYYLGKKLPMLLISILGIMVGLILITLWAVSGKKLQLSKGIPGLAVFAIFIGAWSAIETNIYSFFTDRLVLFSWMSYMCLKMSVVPFLLFVNYTFHKGKSKPLHILTICSLAEFWLTSILQYMGIVDYADTVFITHVILMVGSIYIIMTTLPRLLRFKNDWEGLADRKITYTVHSIFIIVVAVTALLDLFFYYHSNSTDIATFSRFGYFGYIIAVTTASLMDFINLIVMGKQAEIIKEEASFDAMTRLRNRAAYEKDIVKPGAKQRKTMGIILFDLNNLKLFNDVYGHDMGDYYIIVSSEVIQDNFARWGKTYRIGGDEFCCIAKNLPEAAFEMERMKLEQRMNELHVHGYDLHMEISSGYALFDPAKDQSLKDTMKRADARMYERKKQLKAKRGVPEAISKNR